MQRNFLSRLTLRAGALACAALLAAPVAAAELGDVTLRSFVGQQLAADIELVGLTLDEMNGLPVRLASADVYSGANLTPDPVLASLRLSVVKREQRWFLHMTTLRPVDANHLYLYLELGSGEHQVVREATVWLAPDPHPAAPPLPLPLVVAAPELPAKTAPPKSVAKVAPKPSLATPQDAASKAAPPAAPDLSPKKASATASTGLAPKASSAASTDAPPKTTSAAVTEPPSKAAADAAKPDAALIAAIARARHPPAPAPARAASAEQPVHAGDGAGASAGQPASTALKSSASADAQGKIAAAKVVVSHATVPTDAAAATLAAGSAAAAAHGAPAGREAAPHAASAPAMVHEAVSAPALRASPAEAAQASCPVKPLRMAAKECIVLDSHSVVISNKIDELEDKVRVLQTALAGPSPAPQPAPSAGSASTLAAAAARAAGHASLPKLKYRDKKEKAGEHGPKMSLLVGAGVAALALVAGVLFWLRKRRAKNGGGPLKIWQSWRKKGGKTADAASPQATPEELMEPQ